MVGSGGLDFHKVVVVSKNNNFMLAYPPIKSQNTDNLPFLTAIFI